MTAVDRYEPTAELATIQDRAVQRLSEWAQSAEAASHVAEQLVKTSFVPESFRGKPYEATAAILAGLECGLSPMASLRSFDVIQGSAAPRAITLRAIVQSQGHEMVLIESTATRCIMKGRRRNTTEWQTVTWTLDRAKTLKLAEKPNWKNQPQAMLVARTTSELARLIAADAILGIAYTVEEIDDGDPIYLDPPAIEPTPLARRMKRTKRNPEPADTSLEDVTRLDNDPPQGQPPLQELEDDNPAAPTEAQKRMAMALFHEAGVTESADRHALTSSIVGRPVTSWNDLTRDEASHVIDELTHNPVADDPDYPDIA